MAEYIEREDLLEKVKELSNTYSYCGLASVHIIKAIEDAPRVDVVEVVRCKDCEYGRGETYEGRIKTPFMFFCTYDDLSYNKAEHFCSNGKRKEGAEE